MGEVRERGAIQGNGLEGEKDIECTKEDFYPKCRFPLQCPILCFHICGSCRDNRQLWQGQKTVVECGAHLTGVRNLEKNARESVFSYGFIKQIVYKMKTQRSNLMGWTFYGELYRSMCYEVDVWRRGHCLVPVLYLSFHPCHFPCNFVAPPSSPTRNSELLCVTCFGQ